MALQLFDSMSDEKKQLNIDRFGSEEAYNEYAAGVNSNMERWAPSNYNTPVLTAQPTYMTNATGRTPAPANWTINSFGNNTSSGGDGMSFDPKKVPETPQGSSGKTFDPNKDWLLKFLPQDLGYMDNLFKNQVATASQQNQNAIGSMENAMNNVSNVNQTYNKFLPGARDEMLGGMGSAMSGYGNTANQATGTLQSGKNNLSSGYSNATGTYQNFLNQAIGTAGQSTGNYTDMINNLTIPQGANDTLNKMLENQRTNVERSVRNNANQLGKNWLEGMGARNMIDSSRFVNGVTDITNNANAELAATNRDLENAILSKKLQLPFDIAKQGHGMNQDLVNLLESGGRGISELQARGAEQGYQADSDLAQLLNQSGLNLAEMGFNQGEAAYQSASDAYKQLLGGAMQEAELPAQYMQMVNDAPYWAHQGQTGYMDNMMNIWKMLLEKQIADRQADITEDANDKGIEDFIFG